MPKQDFEADAKNIKYLELGQVHRILDCVSSVSKNPVRDILLIEVMWRTGARISEAIQLMAGHILSNEFGNIIRLKNLKQLKKDNNGRYVRETIIIDGKKKQRFARDEEATKEVTVSKKFCRVLLDYCTSNGFRENDYVFPNSRSKTGHTTRLYVWRILDRASKKADIRVFGKKNPRSHNITKGAYPHMLRHSTAMHLLEKTNNIKLVQQILGHASVRTTQVYAYVKTKAIEKQIEEIEW